MPLTEFEPAVPGSERQQTYALDRAATGICVVENMKEYPYLISRGFWEWYINYM